MAAWTLAISAGLSALGCWLTFRLIREFMPILIKANMFGVDQCKRKEVQRKIPEPMGAVTATVFLMVMFIFIPFPFYRALTDESTNFPHEKFVEFVAGLLSICCMIFLGFGDDVLDLRWRHKLLLPTLASLPLLMVYAANFNSTSIMIPRPLIYWLGKSINLGFVYYIFMGMLAVFCTNAINILAGINGLEAGQSVVIAISVAVFNVIQLIRMTSPLWYHYFSLYLLLPYIGTTSGLLYMNWYPAEVFVGDTFCYFSGMTFAVVGILGHFSKTLLLFFLPQIFNFLYSLPQLFRYIPCPRHRLPKYDPETDKLNMSMSRFNESDLSVLGHLCLRIFELLGLLHVRRDPKGWTECNNLTLINLVLKFRGPMHEKSLTTTLLVIQVIGSLMAFTIRFLMAGIIYDKVL